MLARWNLNPILSSRAGSFTPPPRRVRRARQAQLSAEALIIIPILLIITIGVVEFGLLVSLRQAVAHAATRGVREASKGAPLAELDVVIGEALSGFDVTLATNAGYRVEDPALSLNVTSGALVCDAPASAFTSGRIRVTVCAESSGSPVSGLISKFGASNLLGKILTASAVATKECPPPSVLMASRTTPNQNFLFDDGAARIAGSKQRSRGAQPLHTVAAYGLRESPTTTNQRTNSNRNAL